VVAELPEGMMPDGNEVAVEPLELMPNGDELDARMPECISAPNMAKAKTNIITATMTPIIIGTSIDMPNAAAVLIFCCLDIAITRTMNPHMPITAAMRLPSIGIIIAQ